MRKTFMVCPLTLYQLARPLRGMLWLKCLLSIQRSKSYLVHVGDRLGSHNTAQLWSISKECGFFYLSTSFMLLWFVQAINSNPDYDMY